MNINVAKIAVFLAVLTCLSAPAVSQERHQQRNAHAREAPHVDARGRNDRGFPPLGYAATALPRGSIHIAHGGGHYFFDGGVWFRPYAGRYLVIAPPIGIVVPMLPPGFFTLDINGMPYYYANGTYYMMQPEGGYTVVAPPSGMSAAPSVPFETMPSPLSSLVIQPRNGQSNAQSEADQQACNGLAATQPGAATDATIYQRSFAVCMNGLGYTVR
jgi:hypothetical protein